MLPFVLLFVAVIGFTAMFGSAFANVKNGGTITYNEQEFQKYADQQYLAEFGGTVSSYEDNILIVFLANEEADGYYTIAWVGDNVHSRINEQFGNEYTPFGIAMQSSIDGDYYAYSISQNLAMAVDKMTDNVTALGLESSFRTQSLGTHVESHLTNNSSLTINENTVEQALTKFTEETDIPIVIVVDTMENVFGKHLSFSDIFTMLIFIGLAVFAIVMIVRTLRAKRNEKQS